MENVKEGNKTLKKVGNIVFYVVLAIVLIYAMFALFSNQDENRISFFGMTSMAVQTDSMEPTFEAGDLIFVDTSFDLEDLAADFDAGKKVVITFSSYDTELGNYYNTHTVINYTHNNGIYRFTTKGDNPDYAQDDRQVTGSEIYGVWTGNSWSNFGSFADGFTSFIKSGTGFFILIVLPALAFLGYEVYRFIKVYGEYSQKKGQSDRVAMQEAAVAEAKRQLEEEQKLKEKEETKEDVEEKE